jgi:ADP-ribosylglycohydrolase
MSGPVMDRIAGALFGIGVGDATGSTTPTEGTHITAMTLSVITAYGVVGSHASPAEAARAEFTNDATTHRSTVDLTTATALMGPHQPPNCTGHHALPRVLPAGLVRTQAAVRLRDAAELTQLTHPHPDCVASSALYAAVVSYLITGADPATAIRSAFQETPTPPDLRCIEANVDRWTLHDITALAAKQRATTTLGVALWAVSQPVELAVLTDIIAGLPNATPTMTAVVCSLLGARDGHHAIPKAWFTRLLRGAELCSAAAHADRYHHLDRHLPAIA